jgi:ESCRT-I complex subunit VPS28
MYAAGGGAQHAAGAAAGGGGGPSIRAPLDESRPMAATETTDEKRRLTEMEELYAIMRTTEHLEKAYVRDRMSADEYKVMCRKLQTAYDMQKDKLSRMHAIADMASWMREYAIELPEAYMRLEVVKLPATDTHYSDDGRPDALHVSETTSALITAMDGITLNRTDVDQVAPCVSAVLESLNRHAWLPAGFEGKAKMAEWARLLAGKTASDSLSDEQARQLNFDLQQAYEKFLSVLATLGRR